MVHVDLALLDTFRELDSTHFECKRILRADEHVRSDVTLQAATMKLKNRGVETR